MAKKSSKGEWVIYNIRYQTPKFGSEGKEFLPEIHTFMVSTDKGPGDAREAFTKYHPGCRLVVLLDPMSTIVDNADGSFTNAALMKLEAKK